MRTTAVLAAALSACALLLAGCDAKDATPAASLAASEDTADLLAGDPTAEATGAVLPAADIDSGALAEKRDPERLLRFYGNAVRTGDWPSAARAWTLDAQMTPEKLSAQFGPTSRPKLAIGKGDVEGAAGSLYYETPVVVDFGDGRPSRRGTIVLRRANDVPGASAEQLNWRIERTSMLP
jgi:hypothetical protein